MAAAHRRPHPLVALVALLQALVLQSYFLAAESAPSHHLEVGKYHQATCSPNAWVDFNLNVTVTLADSNILFEVEDLGTDFNPTLLSVVLWEGTDVVPVPIDRTGEHRTDRATGKVWAVGMNACSGSKSAALESQLADARASYIAMQVWAVGMNNECFQLGMATLGVQCGPYAAANFTVHVVSVPASLDVVANTVGEVCPGEWVRCRVSIPGPLGSRLRLSPCPTALLTPEVRGRPPQPVPYTLQLCSPQRSGDRDSHCRSIIIWIPRRSGQAIMAKATTCAFLSAKERTRASRLLSTATCRRRSNGYLPTSPLSIPTLQSRRQSKCVAAHMSAARSRPFTSAQHSSAPPLTPVASTDQPLPSPSRLLYRGVPTCTCARCNVEAGKMYLGMLGDASEGGCMHYEVNVTEFAGACVEQLHQDYPDPAAAADKTLDAEHFVRGSCGPHEWFDFYFAVTAHMVEIEDNIVFEVETITGGYELGGISIHLFEGEIPLSRRTEQVSRVPDGSIYSLAIPAVELKAGAYYLSVQCGPNPQRFRTIAFEIRGRISGPGDAVHGEVCPREWIFHSIAPTFNGTSDNSSSSDSSSSGRRLGDRVGLSRRALAASSGEAAVMQPGDHVKFTFSKHAGDFYFMTLIGDHPPSRKQPPSRHLNANEEVDFGIFCNVQPGNRYWIALLGGTHCAMYDLFVHKLAANDTRCATGEYSLVPNELDSSGLTEALKEVPMYGSCAPGEYVDYFVPLTFAADSDENLRFQVELRSGEARPDALTLLIYSGGTLPVDRQTEIFADRSSDGVYSVTINVIELKYQLCVATDFADTSCGDGHYLSSSASSSSGSSSGSSGGSSSGSSSSGRRLGGAPAPVGGAEADLTYFVSVRCSPSSGASFKFLTSAIKSHLVNRQSVHGELCPGGFIYHHWEHDSIGEVKSVKFTVTKHGGDGSIMVSHGASFDEAPLKLAPPYLYLDENTEHTFVEYCNATDAVNSHDHVYVTLVGGVHCMSYEIMAQEEPNSECHGMGHGSEHSAGYIDAKSISPHHFVHGSCSGSEWVDFSLTLSAADYHYTYLLEAEDLTASEGNPDNTALSLHLFDATIPASRKTDQRVLRSVDGIYSLSINRHNFHAGTFFFSMHCEDIGTATRQFRMVVYQIEEHIALDKEYHGEVTPQEWVYHSYTVPTDGVPHNFTFHIIKHMGDMEVVVRHNAVPLKLIPPYTHVGEEDFERDTQVCNAVPGETVYLGMLGGYHAAGYEIIASELPAGAPCEEPPHTMAATADSYTMQELKDATLTIGSCEAGGWYDAYVDVSAINMHNNLLFELEDLEHSSALDAVSVYLWAEEIPPSRVSEYFTLRSYNSIYSLAVSMHEFEPFLSAFSGGSSSSSSDNGSSSGSGSGSSGSTSSSSSSSSTSSSSSSSSGSSVRFFFGVRCADRDVRFRSFVTFVHSKLDTHHIGHGEVCPDEWIYHVLPIDDALILGTDTADSSHRRRLAAIDAHGMQGGRSLASPATKRELAASSSSSSSGSSGSGGSGSSSSSSSSGSQAVDVPGVHVRLRVIKNVGAMNLMLSLNQKPLRLIPSDTTYMVEDDHVIDKVICNIDRYYRNSTNQMRYYLAVNGGTVCAHYEVITEVFTSSCSEAKAAALRPAVHVEKHGSPGARECPRDAVDCVLSMRHYMRGSCSPHERAPPFVVLIPYTAGESVDNLVLEVEDLADADNPSSLDISAYMPESTDCSGSCSHEQLLKRPAVRSTALARKRIFSIGLSSVEMQQLICGGVCTASGTFSLYFVVRCADTAVRFRVISIVTQLALEPGVPIHGEVCPDQWIFHRQLIPDNDATHYAGGVRFHLHVHEGDVYYLITRWSRTPAFAACNENEYRMSLRTDGQADLCHLTEKLESFAEEHGGVASGSGHRRQLASAAATPVGSLSAELLQGYVGLYGGTSCAHYTIESEFLPAGAACSSQKTGVCTKK